MAWDAAKGSHPKHKLKFQPAVCLPPCRCTRTLTSLRLSAAAVQPLCQAAHQLASEKRPESLMRPGTLMVFQVHESP
eukprot:1267838-Rhodomonas_salina.2